MQEQVLIVVLVLAYNELVGQGKMTNTNQLIALGENIVNHFTLDARSAFNEFPMGQNDTTDPPFPEDRDESILANIWPSWLFRQRRI